MATPLHRQVRTPTPRNTGLGDALSWNELPALATSLAHALNPLGHRVLTRKEAQDTAANSLIESLFDESVFAADADSAPAHPFAPSSLETAPRPSMPQPPLRPMPQTAAMQRSAPASPRADVQAHSNAANPPAEVPSPEATPRLQGLEVFEINEPEVFERFFVRARG